MKSEGRNAPERRRVDSSLVRVENGTHTNDDFVLFQNHYTMRHCDTEQCIRWCSWWEHHGDKYAGNIDAIRASMSWAKWTRTRIQQDSVLDKQAAD